MPDPRLGKQQSQPSDTAVCALTVGFDQAADERPAPERVITSASPQPLDTENAGAAPRSSVEPPIAPRGPPSWLGFHDEYSCGVTEFLRRVGFGRTKLYQLLDGGEIESFLLDGKRMILIASWLEYVARQQAAERAGQLRKRWAGRCGIGQPEPSNSS